MGGGGGEISRSATSEYVVFVCKLLPREIISALRGRILRPSGGLTNSLALIPPPNLIALLSFTAARPTAAWMLWLFGFFLVHKHNLAKGKCVKFGGQRNIQHWDYSANSGTPAL